MRYIFRLEGPNTGKGALCSDRREPDLANGAGYTGAYMAGISYLDGLQGDYMSRSHPCPTEIEIMHRGKKRILSSVMSSDCYFAFSSLKDCRDWWYSREDMQLAQDNGFRLLIISVEDIGEIITLPKQIMYRPKPWKKGDCPVIRRVYVDATWMHSKTQEELETWADEALEFRERKAA